MVECTPSVPIVATRETVVCVLPGVCVPRGETIRLYAVGRFTPGTVRVEVP